MSSMPTPEAQTLLTPAQIIPSNSLRNRVWHEQVCLKRPSSLLNSHSSADTRHCHQAEEKFTSIRCIECSLMSWHLSTQEAVDPFSTHPYGKGSY